MKYTSFEVISSISNDKILYRHPDLNTDIFISSGVCGCIDSPYGDIYMEVNRTPLLVESFIHLWRLYLPVNAMFMSIRDPMCHG